MNRDMRGANRMVFEHLERFCERRLQPLDSARAKRWIAFPEGDKGDEDRTHLQRGEVMSVLRFGGDRALAHVHVGDTGSDGREPEDFVGLFGFDHEPNVANLVLVDNSPGLMILLLGEVAPRPRVTPAEISNIVEFGKAGESEYNGHRASDIESLFPRLQTLASQEPIDHDSISRIFLLVCASECADGGSWIEEGLAEELKSLTALEVPNLPYSAICESIFDADPRSLFMALYRCVEATFAYETSRRLVAELGVEITWVEMAASLSQVLGWRPQEASSLNVALANALDHDLRELCECLEVEVGNDLKASAGKAIYSLRNRIVHYRPGTEVVNLDPAKWNQICHLMVRVVLDVFSTAYGEMPLPAQS